ncbi:unnamed protein product [Rhizoctonia solani]|uniref:Uncharacterized protein n=1 Tax=Rhizoctonia solani TaxID=456999 RepID=A0A8H2XBT6_9AGAM|nr:unnamed protein product [Rhizoctonia solani]
MILMPSEWRLYTTYLFELLAPFYHGTNVGPNDVSGFMNYCVSLASKQWMETWRNTKNSWPNSTSGLNGARKVQQMRPNAMQLNFSTS